MDTYEIGVPIHFDNEDTFIKDLIKENGVVTCRNEFPKEYISKCLSLFTDGFVILGNKSQIGRFSRGRKSAYCVKGFTLFIHDDLIIQWKVICVDESLRGTGVSTILLDSVKKFALNNRVKYWSFYSLPYEKLIATYLRYGFIGGKKIFNDRGVFKVQFMSMDIDNQDPDHLNDEEYEERIKFIETDETEDK